MAVKDEKTIGGRLIQSGEEDPSHSAPLGTIYVKYLAKGAPTSELFIKRVGDGSTGWNRCSYSHYGGMYIIGNTTATDLAVTPTDWIGVTNLSFLGNKNQAWVLDTSPNDYRLTDNFTDKSAVWKISLTATIEKTSGTAGLGAYDVGISISQSNGGVPTYWGTAVASDTIADHRQYATVNVNALLSVPGTSTIELAVRRNDGVGAFANDATQVIITNATLNMYRYR